MTQPSILMPGTRVIACVVWTILEVSLWKPIMICTEFFAVSSKPFAEMLRAVKFTVMRRSGVIYGDGIDVISGGPVFNEALKGKKWD